MKIKLPLAAAALTALVSAIASAQASIQFGGDIDHLIDPDANWVSQIGADQIIQWNGVNSDGGSFNASGTMVDQGVGATLTSLGAENLVLTTTGISATNTTAGFPLTSAAGSPNVLGVQAFSGEDAAKFNIGNTEAWTFSFNQDVTLDHMIGAAMDFDGERFGIDIGNDGSYEYEWNRSDGFTVGAGSVTAATFDPVTNRYVATPDGGITLPAGTDVTVEGLQGNIGLHGLVVTVPEPSAFAMLAGIGALGLLFMRRRKTAR